MGNLRDFDNAGNFHFAGVPLISMFLWIIYVFGGFLVFTGIKMLVHKEE
jgi:predicted tellurium resistance membrane protein TerC